MNQVIYRTATLQDLPTLCEFEQGIITAERPFDTTLKPGYISYYDLKEFIESDEMEIIVAEVDGKVVGSGHVKIKQAEPFFDHDQYAYLGFMFVLNEFRGQGIISRILEELKKWCHSKKILEMRLQVYNENESAIRAYEKTGFDKYMITMRMSTEV